MKQIIQGLVRHILTSVGGGLVARGVLTGDDLTTAVAGVVVLVGVVWSVVEKRRRN